MRQETFKLLSGGVVLITAALVLVSMLISPSYAEDVNANVNIDNDAPTISGHAFVQDPADDGTNTTVTGFGVAPGPTLTHTVAGNTNVVVKVNVTDSNGWASQPTNVSMRLARLASAATNTDFLDAAGVENFRLPKAGPVACSAIANVSPTERTFLCGVNMLYLADPTTPGSEVTSSTNYQSDHWRALFQIGDTVATVTDYSSVHYEWPEGIGITPLATLLDLGSIATDGTPSAFTNLSFYNDGNQTIDTTTQATETVDATAWTCTGTGNPLITDIHIDSSASTYAAAPPLNINGESYQHTGIDKIRDNNSDSRAVGNVYFSMATNEAITPGTCTLSSIVLTAVKGF